MKILAIDDQQLVLLPLEKRLVALGYEVKTENNGKSGMESFETFQPDLVIVDMNMPNVSGIDVVRFIRNEKSFELVL